MPQFLFRRKRHIHDVNPKIVRQESNDSWIQECSCGMRRTERIGWGSESGSYFSRWYDRSEIDKLKRLFPEAFENNQREGAMK
jgi:hypothetical protein